ncbi:MAG TPA: cell envelope integrity protein TolA [Acidobacteriaceae bacterium]|nr:cell envelope integrity protein TolA [Acidobacteriaceae bacterium]
MAAIETPPSPPEKPIEPKFDRLRTRYESHSPHELLDVIDSLEGERLSARVREAIWVSLIFHLLVFWWIFYGPKLKMFQPATVVNTMPLIPAKAPENVYLDMPPDLVKKPPKPTNIISDQNHTAQTRHPTPDQKTIEELQAMRRAGRPSPPPQPQQRAQQPEQPAARPQQPSPQREQARAVPPSKATPPPLPSAPNATQSAMQRQQAPRRQTMLAQNQATSQPNMSVGDMIRQAERNAARSNGEGGDNGDNAPIAHPGVASGVEVLSDTMGVDFGPYLHQVVQMTQSSWDLLIPEAARPPLLKQGTVAIQFIILPDGSIKQMQLIRPSGDVSLDRAAWGGITGAGPFPPLPKQFKGPYLALRFYFLYNEQTGQYTRE